MMKGLMFLLFVVLCAAVVGGILYSMYRLVRRENDLDIEELNEAADNCRKAAEDLERKTS